MRSKLQRPPNRLMEADIRMIDLMKMNAEGAEASGLRSSVGSWLRSVRVLVLGEHRPEIVAVAVPVLQNKGFAIHWQRSVWRHFNSENF